MYYRDAWALLAFVFWGRSTAAVVAGLIIGLTVHSAHHCLAPRHQSLATQTESFAARFTAALIPVPAAANYDGPPIPGDIPQLILTACRRAAATESQRLRRGLNGLATIASSAPFFGFLGTSIGIVNSFRGGSGERTAMMAAIAHHLAEALLLTAWSLALAVLAHAAHRALKKQHRALELQMESCALALAKL